MSFMKRAVLYVTRKKGKSIVLFILLLLMATFVLSGLSISKAAQITQSNLRQTLGGTFTISPDYSDNNPYARHEKDNEGNVNIYTELPVTKELIDTVMSIDGIKSFKATAQTLVLTELDLFPGNVPLKTNYQKQTTVRITLATEKNSFFQSNILKLMEGSDIPAAGKTGVAMISKNLAERNNLKIGDKISLQSDGKTDVEIIGIFEILKPDSPLSLLTTYEKLENQIFIDFDTYQNLIPWLTVGFQTVSFEVKDPAELDHILSQLKKLSSIDWQAFQMEADNQTYLAAAAPLQKLQSLMSAVLIVITVISAIVLSLILTMWAKNRIHETGVYLSFGIRKSAIISQYLAEVLLIAVVAFGLSYFTSNTIAGKIGNELLQQNELEMQNNLEDKNDVSISVKGDSIITTQKDDIKNKEPLPTDSENKIDAKAVSVETDSIIITVGFNNMAQLYLIGFAVIILSVGISSAAVMRLKPREILTKMS